MTVGFIMTQLSKSSQLIMGILMTLCFGLCGFYFTYLNSTLKDIQIGAQERTSKIVVLETKNEAQSAWLQFQGERLTRIEEKIIG